MMEVDFTRIIGSKTFEELCLEVFTRLSDPARKFPLTNFNVGGVFRTHTEALLQAVADLYALLPKVAKQAFILYAQGPWLDLGAAEFGLTRFPARRALGSVVFGRNNIGDAVRIPIGTLVKTRTSDEGIEYRYRTTAAAVIPANQLELAVPVEAEAAGAAYNVGAQMITVLVSHVPGIDYITNNANWLTSEGSDEENDESLRERCILRWNEFSAGTEAAYKSWARSVAGVIDVDIVSCPRGGDTVDVVIWAAAGFPTSELIATVQAVIDKKRPITDNVQVRGPAIIDVSFEMTVTFEPAATDAEMVVGETQIRRLFDAWFGVVSDPAVTPLFIGRDVDLAYAYSLVRRVSKVIAVQISTPASDIVVAAGARARLTGMVIHTRRADNV